MKTYTKIILSGILLISSYCSYSHQPDQGSMYQKYEDLTDVDIQVLENGIVRNDVSATLLDNKKGSITFLDTKTKKPITKIEIVTSKSYSKGKELISVETEYYTFNNDEWVSKSNTSILNKPGSEGTISIYSDVKSVDLIITAYFVDDEATISDSSLNKITSCDNHTKSSNCCSSDCQDGSGNKLKCCGVISCTGCGTSCKVESGSIGEY